jgi:intein-encoded DNA endonuclease-like protein
MPAERKQRLDAIGFVWDGLEDAWEEGFSALSQFKAREGQCNVPSSYIEGAFNLGRWVRYQSTNKDMMPAERKQRLDEIGFVWDAPVATKKLIRAWEEGFAALKTFKSREGHCRVRIKHVEGSFKLGTWVDTQRQNKDKMPAERKQRLDAIGVCLGCA